MKVASSGGKELKAVMSVTVAMIVAWLQIDESARDWDVGLMVFS
jgi:hypothetical protein